MPDIENNPDASRVIKGLRDTGYEFVTAAADVVDNSIEANAKNIKISLELERDGKKFVYIADDGDGMDKAGLLGAMKYGADERANPESLGKFGLGLKTASSAICLKFSVISRKSGAEPLNKLSWDLEYVKKVNKWVHPEDPLTTAEEKKFAEYCGEKGTLVIWSKCDRLLPTYYAEPGGTKEKAAIKRLANRLGEHCALTYHRFLDNKDKRANNVFIEIDGNPIEAWNPFLPDHAEQMLPDKKKKIVCELQDGSNAPAFMAAWILPHNDDLTDELKKKANIKNNRQGFYIFRYNRLIHSGDWLGMWINEPHHVLFRVEFDFGYELDDAFRVPVNKKGIEFDPELHKVIKSILQPIYLEARKRFDKVAKKQATRGIDHESSSRTIEEHKSSLTVAPVVTDPSAGVATLTNTTNAAIKIKIDVQSDVNPASVFVTAADDITSGNLWETSLRSPGKEGHQWGVKLNTHHDFYQKIYQRAKGNGYAVNGIDYLLWAFATAEMHHTDDRLTAIFDDMRDEISSNLRKLLRDLDIPAGLDEIEQE